MRPLLYFWMSEHMNTIYVSQFLNRVLIVSIFPTTWPKGHAAIYWITSLFFEGPCIGAPEGLWWLIGSRKHSRHYSSMLSNSAQPAASATRSFIRQQHAEIWLAASLCCHVLVWLGVWDVHMCRYQGDINSLWHKKHICVLLYCSWELAAKAVHFCSGILHVLTTIE